MDRLSDPATEERLAKLEATVIRLERTLALMAKKSLSPEEAAETLGLPKKGT